MILLEKRRNKLRRTTASPKQRKFGKEKPQFYQNQKII